MKSIGIVQAFTAVLLSSQTWIFFFPKDFRVNTNTVSASFHFLWNSAYIYIFFCTQFWNQRTQMQAKYPGMGDSVILEYEVLFWVILGKSIRNTHLGSSKWRSRLKISIFTTSQVFLYPLRCSVILIGAEFCPFSRKSNLYLIGDGYTFRVQKCLKF